MYTILIVNGPNLGYLGMRQPDIYGHLGMDALPQYLQALLQNRVGDLRCPVFQSNHEGALIDRLEAARTEDVHGIVLNAGALTHTSLALADCLAWIDIPCIEVHASNILARAEPLRHTSLLAPHCLGVIAGFGLGSYALAVQALLLHLDTKGSAVLV